MCVCVCFVGMVASMGHVFDVQIVTSHTPPFFSLSILYPQAKEILFVRSLLNSYISEYTGQPIDKIQEDCDRDFFMTPEEAVAYGMIDSIVTTKTSHLKKPTMPALLW